MCSMQVSPVSFREVNVVQSKDKNAVSATDVKKANEGGKKSDKKGGNGTKAVAVVGSLAALAGIGLAIKYHGDAKVYKEAAEKFETSLRDLESRNWFKRLFKSNKKHI